jgi:hypothetical protein
LTFCFRKQVQRPTCKKIIDDTNADPRIKVLAYNKQHSIGHKPNKKELLAVVVEVGLDEGPDVLASLITVLHVTSTRQEKF